MLFFFFSIDSERIYFDGGLPLSKRETRLERLEKSRSKLENFCFATLGGFKLPSVRKGGHRIEPSSVFSKQPQSSKFSVIPENPFMMAAVIEDLEIRWNWQSIADYSPGVLDGISDPGAYPWASISHVVPGEADSHCAGIAKSCGAAVLTGDSDLLVYDLGPNGSVIFFDSLDTAGNSNRNHPQVKGTEMCPDKITKQLGMRSFQRFAFELKQDRFSNMATVIRRSQGENPVTESSASYLAFLKEYGPSPELSCVGGGFNQTQTNTLDPRVSELLPQFEDTGLNSDSEHVLSYLPILIENHNRRCAWVNGSDIRILAYSLLNLSMPEKQRRSMVLEHVRRGHRIYPTRIQFLSRDEVEPIAEALLQRLKLTLSHNNPTCLGSWRLIALLDIYSGLAEDSIPSRGYLRKFFESGYTEEKLQWDDIYLHAQIQSFLYSLRMLKQLVSVALSGLNGRVKELGDQLHDVLAQLPPMRALSEPKKEFNHWNGSEIPIDDHLDVLFSQTAKAEDEKATSELDETNNDDGNWEKPRPKKRKREKKADVKSKPRQQAGANIFEILQQQ